MTPLIAGNDNFLAALPQLNCFFIEDPITFTLYLNTQQQKYVCRSSELKTEEGYSADIVRTYIPGDICPNYVRTTSPS